MFDEILHKIPEKYRSAVAAVHNQNILLHEEVCRLRRALFCSKSERFIVGCLIEPKGTLFNEAEEEFELCGPPLPPGFGKAESSKPKGRRRSSKSGGRKPLPKDLPRKRVVHDLSEEAKKCNADGSELKRIGEEVVEKLEFQPATLIVVDHVYPKYACPSCKGEIKQAPAEPCVLPRSQCGPGLLAQIIMGKYFLGLPLYRQEKDFEEMGIELKRTSMARWVVKSHNFLKPLLSLMKSKLDALEVAHADETVLQVLKEKGKPATSKSYMWTMCSGRDDPPMVWYEYHRGRGKESAEHLLKNFRGLLHVDGYGGYNSIVLANDLTRVGCWAHGRRYFDSAKKNGSKKASGRGLTNRFLSLIQKLFLLERKWEECNHEKRLEERKVHSKPVVEEIETLLEEAELKVVPKSKLGNAVGYLRNEWEHLTVFLKDGRAELSNNRKENFIRPYVIGRKGWLFSDTVAGAEASAGLYSLMITARANGIHARPYLISLFTELPHVLAENPDADLTPWLPWEWKKSKASPEDFITEEAEHTSSLN